MAKLHIRRTVIFIILGALCGFLYILFTPKVYEGQVQLMIGSATRATGSENYAPDVQKILASGDARNPLSELGVMRGQGLFFAALQKLSQLRGNPDMLNQFERYYSMYDVLGEKESDNVVMQARAFTPEDAADLANIIAQEYNERRLAVSRTSVFKAIEYLTNQLDAANAASAKALDAKQKFKAQMAISDLTTAIAQAQGFENQLLLQLNESEANLAATNKEVASTEAALKVARQRKDREVGTTRNPAINKLEADKADLLARRASMLSTRSEDHWDIQAIDRAIASTEAELSAAKKNEVQTTSKVNGLDPTTQQLDLQYQQALIRKAAIEGQAAKSRAALAAQQDRMRELTAAEQTLAGLERAVVVSESNIRSLNLQLESLQNRGEGQGAIMANVIFDARPRPEPVFPNVVIVALLSIFGGGAIGILYSFVVESLRLRIYTSWQLADLTGLPVIASLPRLPAGAARQIEGSLQGTSPKIMESLRLLAFSLVAQPHEGCRRLMFTGLDRNTGTSSSAAQVALAIGHTGSRVIFVDGDMMTKESSRYFKAEGQKGFAELLQTGAAVETASELLRDTGTPNVKVLPAGLVSDRALKECETVQLENVLTWLSERCDFLIIDCPPCLRNSEAARLAAETDEAYLVVSLKISSVPIVSAALDILRQAGAEIVRLLTTEGDKSEEALARESRVTAASRALPQ